jgi:hypothetical protein
VRANLIRALPIFPEDVIFIKIKYLEEGQPGQIVRANLIRALPIFPEDIIFIKIK